MLSCWLGGRSGNGGEAAAGTHTHMARFSAEIHWRKEGGTLCSESVSVACHPPIHYLLSVCTHTHIYTPTQLFTSSKEEEEKSQSIGRFGPPEAKELEWLNEGRLK